MIRLDWVDLGILIAIGVFAFGIGWSVGDADGHQHGRRDCYSVPEPKANVQLQVEAR